MLRSRVATLGALAVALLAGGLALAACGGGDEAQTTETVTLPTTEATETEATTEMTVTTTTIEEEKPVVVRITVLGGAPQGGIVRETVSKGDRVVLHVRSDQADEVHVHGYDLSRPVTPGNPARIAFVADVPGRFEVELEESGVQVADLTVRP